MRGAAGGKRNDGRKLGGRGGNSQNKLYTKNYGKQ